MHKCVFILRLLVSSEQLNRKEAYLKINLKNQLDLNTSIMMWCKKTDDFFLSKNAFLKSNLLSNLSKIGAE